MKLKTEKFSLFLILLAGLLLRLLAAQGRVFWFDEAITWSIAKQNLLQMTVAIVGGDNHPPLYYLLLHFWLKLNDSEIFLRFPSIIFGLISIYLTYLIGKKIINERVGIFSAAITSFSPLHIYFSGETRMYSLWTMLIMFGFYQFLKLLQKPKTIHYILFTLWSLLALYTHYFTIFFLLALNLFLILNRKKNQKILKNLIVLEIVIIFLFSPWLIFFSRHHHPSFWTFSPWTGIPITIFSYIVGGLGQVTQRVYLFSPQIPLIIKLFLIFATIFLGLIFLKGLSVGLKSENKMILLFPLFIPIVLVSLLHLFFFYFLSLPLYAPRAFIAFSFPFYILLSLGLESIKKKRAIFNLKISTLAIFLLIFLLQNLYSPFKPQAIREAAEFIKNSSTDSPMIVHTDILTFYPFQYYFRNEKTNQFLIFPSGLTRQTTEIIGGSPITFSEVINQGKPFFSLHFVWDEKTWKLKEEQQEKLNDFKYDLVKKIDDLEIFYYRLKDSFSALSDIIKDNLAVAAGKDIKNQPF